MLVGQQAESRSITLAQAVSLATAQNPNVQITLVDAALANERQRRALSALLPQVTVGFGDAIQRINVETSLGTTAGLLPQHEGPFQSLSTGTRFSVPLIDAANLERYRAQKAGTTAARADAKTAREEITALTVAQYLLCIRLSATVSAVESQVALAQRLFDQADHLEQAGVGTGLDTLRAKQKFKVQQQALIVTREEADTSLFSLVRILNLPPSTTLTLADAGEFRNRPLEPIETTTIEAAYANRPEMIDLNERLKAASRQLASARGERLPSLSIEGAWYEQGNRPDNAIPVYQYAASLSIPIFTGGRIRSDIATSSLQIDRLKREQEGLKNKIALEVKTATAKLEAALNEVDVADAGLQLAQEEVTQAQDRFQAGASDNIEVVTAQDTLARAYDDQIAAFYRANQSRADLARALGHIEDMYKQ